MMPEFPSTADVRRNLLTFAIWPLLAAFAGLAFARFARMPASMTLVIMGATLIAAVAFLSRRWMRFFVALMVFGISLNLDRTFNHSNYIGSVAGLAVSVVDLALAVLVVSAVTRAAMKRTARTRLFWRTTLPALVLWGIMLLSVAESRDLSLSFYQLLERGKQILLYLFVANFIDSEDDVRFIVNFLQVGVIFQAAVATFQYAGSLSPELQEAMGFKGAMLLRSGPEAVELFRPTGTIGHPNSLGSFLAITLPVTAAQLWYRSEKRGTLLPLLTLGAGTLALVMTYSRGAWISFLVGSVVVFVVIIAKQGLRRRAVIWGATSAVVVGAIVLAFAGPVASRIFGDDAGSVENRLRMDALAVRMIQENPWLGVGVNTYGLRMAEYDQFHLNPQNVVHNVYLFTAAESGVFALLSFVWFFVALAMEGVRGVRLQSPYLSMTATAILGGLIGLGLHMMGEMLLSGPPVLVFWLFTGLLAGIAGLARRDGERSPQLRHARQEHPA